MIFMHTKKWRVVYELIKETFKEFNDDHAIYFSASLSFFTIFSLPPIIIIVIAIAGTLLGKDHVSHEIYNQISSLSGHESASQIQEMVQQASQSQSSFFAKTLGVLTLIFASTGVFVAIQNALNVIWGVKPKPKINILKLIRDRILSFALIISISFLLLVSLVIHAGLVALLKFLNFEFATILVLQIVNFIIPLAVITFLFALIFKFLPDAKVHWKDVGIGAFVTALLFTGGKFLIGLYLGQSDFGSAYGAAGTIIIILTWIFCSSIILFWGAEFTQVYACKFGVKIEPADYAVTIETKTIESPELKNKKKT
jgi:membrane protein